MIASLVPTTITGTPATTIVVGNAPIKPPTAGKRTVVYRPTTAVAATVKDSPFTTTTFACSEAEGIGTT